MRATASPSRRRSRSRSRPASDWKRAASPRSSATSTRVPADNRRPRRKCRPDSPVRPTRRASTRSGEIVLECDRDKGEIYVRPVGTGTKPINLFVSSGESTFTLLLKRVDMPADTIVIRDKTPRQGHGGRGADSRLAQRTLPGPYPRPQDDADRHGHRSGPNRYPGRGSRPPDPVVGGSEVLADADLRGARIDRREVPADQRQSGTHGARRAGVRPRRRRHSVPSRSRTTPWRRATARMCTSFAEGTDHAPD